MAKLTGLQRTTLSDISCGSVSQIKHGYGAWRIRGGSPAVVGRLISAGLAQWSASEGGRMPCVLTERGKEALSGGEA